MAAKKKIRLTSKTGNRNTQSKTVQVDENIFLSENKETDLVDHLKSLLEVSKEVHDSQIQKFEEIDKKVYGYLVLEEDDQKREEDNKRGFGIKPTDTVLPLTQVQMDEAVTYFLEVLSTDDGLYGARAEVAKQQVANGFAALMNEHATKFGHERELNKFLFNLMKYNIGGLIPEWREIRGNKIENANEAKTTPAIRENQVLYAGNKLECADMYNLWYDISCNPTELAQEGEYFAICKVFSPFKVQMMANNKQIYGIDRFIDNGIYTITYYKTKPKIRTDNGISVDDSWVNMLSRTTQTKNAQSRTAVEFMKFYVWLDPSKFGLENSEKMSIWRITLANNKYIARAEKMNNAHGMLPIGIGMPWEDDFREATKSYGELLIPFQTFASYQMNIHQKANRKALYGLTFYNKNVVDLDEKFDPVAGKIPVNAPPDSDLKKAIVQFRDTPDTQNTLKDIATVVDLMQQILPTDIMRQVAGLDRATQYQTAATVQGSNRRNLKITKIIDSQAMTTVKNIQMYNIYQYQQSMDILDPQGQIIQINPGQLRDTRIEFTISDGLRGLDRLSMVMNIKEVLNSILQSQQASQQIDVTKVINYWTSLLGDRTDFSQFKFQSAIDALPPEQRDIAFQLLQQAMQQQESQPSSSQGVA